MTKTTAIAAKLTTNQRLALLTQPDGEDGTFWSTDLRSERALR